MRMLKKSGITPCDRRPDRRKVAMVVAAAALFFSATTAQAVVTSANFQVVQSLSSLTYQTAFVVPAVFGDSIPRYSSAQVAGSDTANYTGTILTFIDNGPGTILLGTNSTLIADTTGNYRPFHLPNTDPAINEPATMPGNYGVQIHNASAPIGYYQIISDAVIDFGSVSPLIPSTPMSLSGGTTGSFTLTGQALRFSSGSAANILAFNSSSDTSNLANDFAAAFSNGNIFNPAIIDVGTLSLDGLTLTIPVHSHVAVPITGFGPGAFVLSNLDGQIVATLIPEPSTVTLLGFGVVGLLGCALRARKRKALVA